jgi:hypothetical protein
MKGHNGKMQGWWRVVALVTLVAGGWILGHDLDVGNLPVAGGLAVICAGLVIGLNRQWGKECARPATPQDLDALSEAKQVR